MRYPLLSLMFVAVALSACTGPIIMGTDAAITVATKPAAPPEADTKDQIPPHESWCYSTMGDPECFAHPQDTQPHRLINVDPQNHYPIDAQAYHQAVAADRVPAPSSAPPIPLVPVAVPAPAPVSPPAAADKKDDLGGVGIEPPAPVSVVVP